MQSPMSPMDVEVLDDSEHAHVLEVLPAEDGKSDAEVKAVTVAPFLGRHLYEHQVKQNKTKRPSAPPPPLGGGVITTHAHTHTRAHSDFEATYQRCALSL